MPRQKRNRYTIIQQDPRVFFGLAYTSPIDFFGSSTEMPGCTKVQNHATLVLEIACGRGEYSIGLAEKTHLGETIYPLDTLFIGIDQKGDRIGVGVQRVHKKKLASVRFICGIVQNIHQWFSPGSVRDIRIIHPDPRPKDRDEKRRLTHPRFLALYLLLLEPGGTIRIKTDDQSLFSYTKQALSCETGRKCLSVTEDLASNDALLKQHYGIQTHYEKLAIAAGNSICYGVWQKI